MVQQGKTKKEQRKTMEITLVQIAGAGAGMLTTKRGFNPFVDTVRERSNLTEHGLTTIFLPA